MLILAAQYMYGYVVTTVCLSCQYNMVMLSIRTLSLCCHYGMFRLSTHYMHVYIFLHSTCMFYVVSTVCLCCQYIMFMLSVQYGYVVSTV